MSALKKWSHKMMVEDKDIQKESQREELNELKQTLRLLPEGRRKALMHFVSNEREHGSYGLYHELLQNLTSGFVVQAWDNMYENMLFFDSFSNDAASGLFTSNSACDFMRGMFFWDDRQKVVLVGDFIIETDLRKLANIDVIYPLYMECRTGKTKEIYDKIHQQAALLCSLGENEFKSFAQEVCKPDTNEESAQKFARYEEMKKTAFALHREEYKKNKTYKTMIDEFEEEENKEHTRKTPYIKVAALLTALSAVFTIAYCSSKDKAPIQPVPQIQKSHNTSQGEQKRIRVQSEIQMRDRMNKLMTRKKMRNQYTYG